MGQDHPWEGVQQALSVISNNVAANLQQVAQHIDRQVQPWQRNVGNMLQGMQQHLLGQQLVQQHQQQQQQRHFLAPLAVSHGLKFSRHTAFPRQQEGTLLMVTLLILMHV